MTEVDSGRGDTRKRIIEVAARLLHEHGPASVTTRGVAEAAGVQAPAIYRLFGDKDGLLEAVAEHVMSTYAGTKAKLLKAAETNRVDALDDLRAGWETTIAFGLSNPGVFRLLSDPARVRESRAARAGRDVLAGRVRRVAATGRLRVSEKRAVDLIQAAGIGTIQTLLAAPPNDRDAELAAAMYNAVLCQILTDQAEAIDAHNQSKTTAAVALRAVAHELDPLTPAERLLITEWLDRAIGNESTLGEAR